MTASPTGSLNVARLIKDGPTQLPRNFRIETERGRYLLVWDIGDHTILMDITEYQMKLLLHGGVPPAGARIERG